MHIEVLNEKIEEFEKEKKELRLQMKKEHRDIEQKMKIKFQTILDQK